MLGVHSELNPWCKVADSFNPELHRSFEIADFQYFLFLPLVDSLLITRSSDPFTRGLDYLYGVRSLALEPDMVDLVHDVANRTPVCTWIGHHIEAVNASLAGLLQSCQQCFHPWEQRSIRAVAVPLAQGFEIDGFCNLKTNPITLLLDVGRVVPEDWLALVMHEYAHAHVGSPGHHQAFAEVLAHLCLGLEIAPPVWKGEMEAYLRVYPKYRNTVDRLAFWRGEGANEATYARF